MKRLSLALGIIGFTISGCSVIPEEAYFDRGGPESLLDVSAERVTLGVDSEASLEKLVDWINQDQPTRAEVYCQDNNPHCVKAQEAMTQFGVPMESKAALDNRVVLIYERVLARDCENRYINNNINPYHLNHPTFGCSTASNMVQMISDRNQIVNPGLLDYSDGEKAAQTYRRYQMPAGNTGQAGGVTSRFTTNRSGSGSSGSSGRGTGSAR